MRQVFTTLIALMFALCIVTSFQLVEDSSSELSSNICIPRNHVFERDSDGPETSMIHSRAETQSYADVVSSMSRDSLWSIASKVSAVELWRRWVDANLEMLAMFLQPVIVNNYRWP